MNKTFSSTGAWVSGLIALLPTPGAPAAPGLFNVSYRGEFQGFALNNLGDVVGQRTDPDTGTSSAAVYLSGASSLPAAPADGGRARDINDSGQVASTVRSIVGGINEWGWIVGRTGNAAVLWDQ